MMEVEYNLLLVLVSYAIAVFGSYVYAGSLLVGMFVLFYSAILLCQMLLCDDCTGLPTLQLAEFGRRII